MVWDLVNGQGNLQVPSEIPFKFRQLHAAAIRMIDNRFTPTLSELFTPTNTPMNGSVHQFPWPKTTPSGAMSWFFDRADGVRYLSAAAEEDMIYTQETKIGYKRRTDEFKEEFLDGIIEQKYENLASDATKCIARFQEYACHKMIYLDSTFTQHFTTQDHGRSTKLDCASGSDNLTGYAWNDTTNSKPYFDITAIDKKYGEIASSSITRGFIGNASTMYLKRNADLTDRTKYTREVAGRPLGMEVAGCLIKKVTGSRYKADSADSSMIGYPALGSLVEDTWASRNQFEMMRDAAGENEWGFFCDERPLGNMYYAKVSTENHANPQSVRMRVLKVDEPEEEYHVILEKRFAPVIEDYANYIILDGISPI